MAASVTETRLPKRSRNGYDAEVVQLDWVSDAGGNATATVSLFGYVQKIVTDPGPAAPTDNYDLTLVQFGVDMLASILLDRDTTNNEIVYGIAKNGTDLSPLPIFLVGDHTFTVANAGDTKSGTVYIIMTETV